MQVRVLRGLPYIYIMKYIIEIINPEYIEVDASSEEDAINKVRSSIQDARLQAYVQLKVCKEVKLEDKK